MKKNLRNMTKYKILTKSQKTARHMCKNCGRFYPLGDIVSHMSECRKNLTIF